MAFTGRCDDWEILPGSDEYRLFEIEGNVTLDAQPVWISVDHGVNWIVAEWTGPAATTREGRVKLAYGAFPQNRNPVKVWAKVDVGTEIIVLILGNAYVR